MKVPLQAPIRRSQILSVNSTRVVSFYSFLPFFIYSFFMCIPSFHNASHYAHIAREKLKRYCPKIFGLFLNLHRTNLHSEIALVPVY